MSIFSRGDRQSNFIHNFYKRDLNEGDLRKFDKETMRVSKTSKLFRKSLEQQELQALYREAEHYRHQADLSQDKGAIERCNRNMKKLAALAWPDIKDVSPFAIGGSDSEGSELSEEEILEKGGFSEEEVQEMTAMLKSLGHVETVSVVNPKHLTREEQEKIERKEREGIRVFISPAPRIVVKNREKMSFGVIDQETKRELVNGPIRQVAKDFDRDLRITVFTDSGLRRFDPKDEKKQTLTIEEADAAALKFMDYVENLPGLTIGERVFVLANSEQNIYGEAMHAFQFEILPDIQAALNFKNPDGQFVATAKDKSELVLDARKKQSTFSQIVTVGDLNQQGEEKGATPPLVLQFKLEATLDWKTGEMVLDRLQLTSADATSLKR
jgi:hypothetical protein